MKRSVMYVPRLLFVCLLLLFVVGAGMADGLFGMPVSAEPDPSWRLRYHIDETCIKIGDDLEVGLHYWNDDWNSKQYDNLKATLDIECYPYENDKAPTNRRGCIRTVL